MKSHVIPLLAAALIMAPAAVQAEQFNQPRHLQVGSMAKIQRVIAKSKALSSRADKGDKDGERRCGEERDGVIVDRSGNEDIIVATRDIITTNGDVEIGRSCR